MKQKIHINDQGELLLIEVTDTPKSPSALAPLVVWEYYDIVSFPSYQAALTSAIEKGIRFRDQEATKWLLINEFNGKENMRGWFQPGKSFDLPNSYTANTIPQRKHKDSDVWVNCDPVSVDEDGSYSYRKVAILISLKHARSHSSETIKKVIDTITPEEQEETERKMLSGDEVKKEEQLFTKEDLRTAFEAGESHYDFQNWFIEKFD